jgi:hypothetical protein
MRFLVTPRRNNSTTNSDTPDFNSQDFVAQEVLRIFSLTSVIFLATFFIEAKGDVPVREQTYVTI